MDKIELRYLIQRIEQYYTIFLIVFGLIGNSICLRVLYMKRRKVNDPNFILNALILSDSGFLFWLAVIKLPNFNIKFLDNVELVCKMTPYFMYVFNFTSSWCIVVYSIERFVVVFYPFSKYKRINNRNKAILLGILFAIPIIFYSFVLFANGYDTEDGSRQRVCHWNKWIDLAETFIFVETVMNIFLPFLIILFINALICIKLLGQSCHRKRNNEYEDVAARNMLEEAASVRLTNRKSTINYANVILGPEGVVNCEATLARRRKAYIKSIVNLIIILTVFLLLNAPMVYSNIRVLLLNYEIDMSDTDQIIFFLARDLFYLNFSINLFLYAFDRSKLRPSVLCSCLLKSKCKKSYNQAYS